MTRKTIEQGAPSADPPAATPPPEAGAPSDPFTDLSKFALSQDFSNLGVERLLLRIPVRKPNRQEFVRVHPDEAYSFSTMLFESKEEREYFLPTPDCYEALFQELVPVRLFTTINRAGTLFIWPARLPNLDGGGGGRSWHESALELAEHAKTSWIRVASDRNLGGYQGYKAAIDLPEPVWPDRPFSELMKIAFASGHLIDREDHPVIRQMLGLS
jgi:hypothetical protein